MQSENQVRLPNTNSGAGATLPGGVFTLPTHYQHTSMGTTIDYIVKEIYLYFSSESISSLWTISNKQF